MTQREEWSASSAEWAAIETLSFILNEGRENRPQRLIDNENLGTGEIHVIFPNCQCLESAIAAFSWVSLLTYDDQSHGTTKCPPPNEEQRPVASALREPGCC